MKVRPTNKNQNQPKVKRVIFEYENGVVRYIEDEDAINYLDQINGILGFVQLSRPYMVPKNFLKVEWKQIDKVDAKKLFQDK